jgi:hypothetical protein
MTANVHAQPMAYVAAKPAPVPSREELRNRIPGWGVDLDRAVRPQVPRERIVLEGDGPAWAVPEQQPELIRRERSVEHGRLTPVFGTAVPLQGLSGRIRRRAYRASEAQASHWLLLMLGDRVDAWEHMVRSWGTLHPDNPVTQTGIVAEFTRHGWGSRAGRGRVDLPHHVVDAVRLGGPWLLGGAAVVAGVRRLRRLRPGR